ncbi:MAG: hypothetical protein HC888_18410 [Candidatus Competibacteraceae bacterium]|nr:hypothetical protein [Candidatus Competibacteraceae bacterium]
MFHGALISARPGRYRAAVEQPQATSPGPHTHECHTVLSRFKSLRNYCSPAIPDSNPDYPRLDRNPFHTSQHRARLRNTRCATMPAMKLRDACTALLLFGTAAAIGMLYPATWGGTPHFFQELFGPAVLFACGHGWANPVDAEAPALQAFLHPAMHVNHPPATGACDCHDVPKDLPTAPWSSFQQRQRYLIYAAGFLWRIFGVSWAALAPLYGLLYGLSALALYALFRLGMHRPIAITATLLLISSPIQLNNLLRLRDYSKAPFILLAIALVVAPIVAWLVWPWMWHDTPTRVWGYVEFVKTHFHQGVWYDGPGAGTFRCPTRLCTARSRLINFI